MGQLDLDNLPLEVWGHKPMINDKYTHVCGAERTARYINYVLGALGSDTFDFEEHDKDIHAFRLGRQI